MKERVYSYLQELEDVQKFEKKHGERIKYIWNGEKVMMRDDE